MSERRQDLMRRRLFELEQEAARLYVELGKLGANERLPGTYMVVEAGRFEAVVPASAVCEIVRLVEYLPAPGAPAHVLGSFIYRGTPVVAIDLARYFGAEHEPALDAHVAVLASSRPMALVTDRVRALIDTPVFAGTSAEADDWKRSKQVVGLCSYEGRTLPIIGLGPLLASLEAPPR